MKLFAAPGWFAVYAQAGPPYRLVLPLAFWALDGEVLRGIVPRMSPLEPREGDPGPGLTWADALGEGGLALLGFYHHEFTPKSHIQALVEEALVQGARLATGKEEGA